MATKRYLGIEVRRTEKHQLSVTAVAVGVPIGITINSKTVQYIPVTGDTTTTAAANLVAAIRDAVDAEFKQFNVSVNSTTATKIDIVMNEPGVFLTADGNTALTVVSGGGSTITDTVTQAGKSPADGADTVNWSGGALPANSGDDWYFEDAPFPMWYNTTTAFTGKSATSITVRPTFSGNGIGLPKFTQDGYQEYRGDRLVLTACTTLRVELPAGAGFEAYRFNTGTTAACALTVIGQGDGTVGQEAVEWIGGFAGTVVEVLGGSLRIAPYVGDVATVPILKVVNGAVTLGAGVTLTTATIEDSGVDMRCNCTTMTIDGQAGSSQVAVRNTAAFTTLTIQTGTVLHNSSGTIGTLEVGPGATVDFSGSADPMTITNKVKLHKGATFWDPNGRVTLTAGWTTVQCAASDVTFNAGVDRSYSVS